MTVVGLIVSIAFFLLLHSQLSPDLFQKRSRMMFPSTGFFCFIKFKKELVFIFLFFRGLFKFFNYFLKCFEFLVYSIKIIPLLTIRGFNRTVCSQVR